MGHGYVSRVDVKSAFHMQQKNSPPIWTPFELSRWHFWRISIRRSGLTSRFPHFPSITHTKMALISYEELPSVAAVPQLVQGSSCWLREITPIIFYQNPPSRTVPTIFGGIATPRGLLQTLAHWKREKPVPNHFSSQVNLTTAPTEKSVRRKPDGSQHLTENAVVHEVVKRGKPSVKFIDLRSIYAVERVHSKRYAPKHRCLSFRVNGQKMIKTSQ